MPEALHPDVVVYVCTNCIPQGGRLPRQWKQAGARILVREVPCSGKTDGQYLLHGLESGIWGLCVVGCPKGECHLTQGNYRAEIRIGTIQRLLAEIGLQPERAELVHSSADDPPEQLAQTVRDAVDRICALGPSPLHGPGAHATRSLEVDGICALGPSPLRRPEAMATGTSERGAL